MLIKTMKRLAVALCLLLVFGLAGCTGQGNQLAADNILIPPKANGDMRMIQKTLEQHIGGKYTLKYPTTGKYRSAYILADLIGAGKRDFAIAFYSTMGSDNVVTMHMCLMKKSDDSWVYLNDVQMAAVGVDKVELSDFDGDGVSEIIVGWNVYGNVDKRVMAYGLTGITLNPKMQESYSDFICCDLLGSGRDVLFLLNHSVNEAVASVRIFSFKNDAVHEIGNCFLDGTVTGFSEPVLSKLSDGTPAVFMDAVKSNGMQTEIVYIKDGHLVTPFYTVGGTGLSVTYRDTSVACLDINKDGCLDIPLPDSASLNANGPVEAIQSVTRWSSYNGKGFTVSLYAMMDYADGYYLEIPSRWMERIVVEKSTETRQRTISLWDSAKGEIVSELVKIRTVTEKEWDKPNNGFSPYVEITRSEGMVYAAMLSTYTGAERIDIAELKSIFHVIG